MFIGRTNVEAEAEAEALVLWPHDVKSRLIEKDPDAEKFSSVQSLSHI